MTAWPTKDAYLSNPEFGEVAPAYFGLPNPACQFSVDQPIGRTRARLDAYGMNLATVSLPGDGWRTQHDVIKWRLAEDAREMGVRCRTEVYGLFAPLLPQIAQVVSTNCRCANVKKWCLTSLAWHLRNGAERLQPSLQSLRPCTTGHQHTHIININA